MVVVYTKNRCVACTQTKKMLDKLGIEYEIINVSENDDAREQLLAEGWLQMPVVKVGNITSWSGFQPEKISLIKNW